MSAGDNLKLMRLLVVTFHALAVLALCYFDPKQIFAPAFSGAERLSHALAYDKEITVEGNEIFAAARINELLPRERSVLWWKLNTPVIETALLASPYLQSAQVESCTGTFWGCFRVRVRERRPAFVAPYGSKAWLIGDDGGVISWFPRRELAKYREDVIRRGLARRLPLIEGVLTDESSPDLLRARLAQMHLALTTIEEHAGEIVESVEMFPGDEFHVRFLGRAPVAIFDGAMSQNWIEALSDRANRLRRVFAELGPACDRVEAIDLAYDRVAVIRSAENI